MGSLSKNLLRRVAPWIGATGLALAAAACSPTPEADPCEDVACEFGVCTDGACVNPESCGGDSSACLPGYACDVDDVCVAEFACEDDGTCARGECVDGACVNPEVCAADEDCAPDSYCDGGACVSDLCFGADPCTRGVCDQTSGECVSAETCTEDAECVAGTSCYEGSCSTDDEICAALDCQRGVCNAAAQACEDAADCAGDDSQCIEGNYCNGATCEANTCDADMVMCPRGVCDPGTGDCVNPETCAASEDCVAMNVCLGGACTPEAEACGAEGCPGNQVCDYDAGALTAACSENPDGCDDANDCSGDRVCAAGQCADPAAQCADDANEDNDDAASATTYADAVVGKSILARACGTDQDTYLVDATNAAVPGQLVMELEIVREDIGLGGLELELTSDDGSVSLGTAQTDAQGRARLKQRVSFASRVPYKVAVRGLAGLSTDGVDYRLFAQVVPEPVVDACEMGGVLEEGVSQTSTTLSGDSLEGSASCADALGEIPEDTWLFTLDEPSFVTVTVNPQSGVDLAVSVREECVNASSEASCVDNGAEAGREVATALLSAGTHAIVVQAPASATTGGAYSIVYSATPTICGPDFATCADADTAQACSANGTSVVDVECGARGCDAATGRCARLDGDVCSQPVAVDGSAGVFTGEVEWNDLANAYAIPPGGCLADTAGTLPVDGPDSAYSLTVPAGHAVRATLDYAGRDVALYAVTSCDALGTTCLAGENTSLNRDETLYWRNTEATDQDLFVIADVVSAGVYNSSDIEIEVAEVICEPTAFTCGTDAGGNDISRECDQFGFDYAVDTICNYGCDAGTGFCNTPPNDACAGAIPLTSGVPVTADIGDFVSDHPLTDAECTGFPTNGPDAVYSFTANADDVVTIDFTSPFDGAIWVSQSCDAGGQIGACFQGEDSVGTNATERLEFVAPATGTYFVTALSFTRTSGAFSLNATVRPRECAPGDPFTCSSGTELQYCNDKGLFETFTCATTCTGGACDQPSGDLCIDPIVLAGPSGQLAAQSFGARTANDIELEAGRHGGCFIDSGQSSNGVDDVFSIDLAADDLLEVTLTTTASNAHLFIFEDCLRAETCAANLPFQGGGTVRYFAETARTVTVVVDYRGSTPPTATYDLDWSVTQGSVCAPGQSFCQDANTQAQCSEDGASVVNTQACAAGCFGGGCQVDLAVNDICTDAAAAASIGAGITVFGTYDDLQPSVALGPNNCTGGATAGPDLLYKVTVPAGQLLRAEAISYGKESAVVYAFRDCADATGSCVAGAGESGTPATASLLYLNSSATDEDLIVALDSRFATSDEPFGLTIGVSAPECDPGAQRCAANGSDVEVCGVFGLYETLTCANGCGGGGCLTPDGGTCAESIALSRAGGTLTDVSWPDGNDSTLARGRTGACLNDASTSGREVFYRIALNAGEMLVAQLETDYPTASVYILPTCGALDQCLSYTAGEGDGSTLVRYVAPTNQEVRVLVDTTGAGANDTFDLTWSIDPGRPCAPGQSRCASPTSVGVCDVDGIAETVYACDGACSEGACATDPTRDVCADANALAGQEINGGAVVYGTFAQFDTNDVELPSTGSCVDAATDGDDTFYAVNVPAGETLRATLTSYDSEVMALYLITDCANPDTTCEEGSIAPSSTQPAVLTYTNTTGVLQRLLLGVDSTTASANGDFALEVDVRPAECTPGQRICSVNGFDQKSCNNDGLFDAYTCNGTCTGAGCDSPTGDICLDALTLTGLSGSVTGDWLGGSNQRDLPTGETGACGVDDSDQTDGREDFYRFALNAGDVLNLDLQTASTTAYLMLFKGCGPSEDTCAYINPIEANVIGTTYFAETNEEVIVVIDNTNTTSTFDTEYTLTWRIGQGQTCAPNTARCVDDTTLAVCDNLNNEARVTCSQGCNVSACNLDAAAVDACVAMNPTLIGDGIAVFGRYDDLSNNTISLPSSGCTGGTTPGNDAFYAIELLPNEGVLAELRGYGGSEDPILYAFTDCADAPGTCVGGDRDPDNDFVSRLDFVNDTGAPQVYYIAVDSSSGADESFFLTVTKRRPDCATPGLTSCGTDNLTLRVCNDDGFNERYLCDGGCAGAACGQPRGEICADSIALTGTSGSFQQMNWLGDSTVTFDPTTSGACIFENGVETDGPEAFYSVTLGAGDLLRASLTTGEADARMFLVSDCADTSSCVAVSERDGSGELFYRSDTGGSFTLVVDVDGTTSSTYSLDYEIISGFTCAPGTARCVDAATLAICRDGGASEQTVLCTCADGACVADVPTTDVCADASAAVDVGAGVLVRGNMDDLTETITLPSSACAGVETDGHDAFYKVELGLGQSVVAEVRSLDNESLALYAFTDCADAENTCLAGTSGASSSNRLTYTNTTGAAQTLFIALDSTATTVDGDYELEITRRDPECTSGQLECSNDGKNIKQCAPGGYFDYFLCSDTCLFGNQCDNPNGDACYEALVLNQLAGTVAGDFNGSNSFELPQGRSGGCIIDDTTTAVTDGPDSFYQITLTQGDLLELELETDNSSAELYILRGCGADQCVENLTSPGTLTYFASDLQETLFIGVDSTAVSSETFELTYTVTSGVACEPGGARCINSSLLELCSADGLGAIGQVTCPGGCFEGRCELDAATANVCADAAALGAVGAGMSVVGSYGSLTDELNPGSNSCVGDTTPGPDAFYRIDVPTGQILVAEATSFGGETPSVYAFSDCNNAETTCVAGNEGSSTRPAELRYLNQSGSLEQLTVAVDSSSGADEFFSLDISLRSPTCTPNTVTCNGSVLSECDSVGLDGVTFDCPDGCTNGGCINPLGDVCFDAVPVNPGGGPVTFTDTGVDVANLNTNMTFATGSCVSTFATRGQEKFYRVLLADGETLSASMDAISSIDPVVYFITDCGSPEATCLDGVDATFSGGTESLSYTNTTGATQSIRVVADLYTASTSGGTFDMTITVQ
jgi:hypothetical protein